MRMKGYVAYLIAFPTLSFFAYYLGIITRAADKRTNGCTFSPWTTDWDRDSGRRTPHGRQPTRTRFSMCLRKMHIAWSLVCVHHTLRASLSGTFLQALPDLVTPLKGHSLSPRSCPATRSAPSERFRY